MINDSYYVLAQFEWVMFLAVVSLCLLVSNAAIRKNVSQPRLAVWAKNALRIWAFGLMLTLCATLAVRFLDIQMLVGAPWAFQIINSAITTGMFLMVLAVFLMAATLLMVIWTWMRRGLD